MTLYDYRDFVKENIDVLTKFIHPITNKALICYICDRLNIFQKVCGLSMITGKSYRSYMTLCDYRVSYMTLYDNRVFVWPEPGWVRKN